MRPNLSLEYAMLAMCHIAREREAARVQADCIARFHGIPEGAIYPVMIRLRHAGLVRSSRGPHGGYCLSRPAGKISLLDIVEAVGGSASDELFADMTLPHEIRRDVDRVKDAYRTAASRATAALARVSLGAIVG
jgi:Rrf2 family protein